MLDELSWNQFQEWIAYSKLDPFAEWRADARSAQIVSTIAQLFRKTGDPIKPISDFMLDFTKEHKHEQTWQEQKQIALMIAASSGEKVDFS